MAKYLVYTCVTNNYDKIRKLLSPQDSNIDFVCFTDKVNKTVDLRKDTGWIFMPIPNELVNLDPCRQARMIKICIFKYLKGYDGYLWIDAPIVIIGNIGEFIKTHPFSDNCGIYVSKHYMRDCVYQEFVQVLRLNKDRSRVVYDQYQKYRNMNYPQHNGMAETSILYRNFKNLKVQVHASIWSEEIMNYSYRDQLSFNWSAWSSNTPITYLSEDIYKRDVENETSKYFFLPYPKHNNPYILEQLHARLNKHPLNGINLVMPPQKVESIKTETLSDFELEYNEFIKSLKNKKVAEVNSNTIKEETKVDNTTTTEQYNTDKQVETPPVKRKRGRPRKIKPTI